VRIITHTHTRVCVCVNQKKNTEKLSGDNIDFVRNLTVLNIHQKSEEFSILCLIGRNAFHAKMNKPVRPAVAYLYWNTSRDSTNHRQCQLCGFSATVNDSHRFSDAFVKYDMEKWTQTKRYIMAVCRRAWVFRRFKGTSSLEMWVNVRPNTQRYISEGIHLHTCGCNNLKPRKIWFV
jgi:hypothetical protein